MIQPLHSTFSVIVENKFKYTLIDNSVIYCMYWSTRWFSCSLPSTVTLAWPDSRPPAVLVSQLYSCPSYTSTLLILRVPLLNSLKRESCREEKEVSFNVELSEASQISECFHLLCVDRMHMCVFGNWPLVWSWCCCGTRWPQVQGRPEHDSEDNLVYPPLSSCPEASSPTLEELWRQKQTTH